jgi:hypothetical protein
MRWRERALDRQRQVGHAEVEQVFVGQLGPILS